MSPPSPYGPLYQPIIVDIPDSSHTSSPPAQDVYHSAPKKTKKREKDRSRRVHYEQSLVTSRRRPPVDRYAPDFPVLIHRVLSCLVYDLTKSPLTAFLIPGMKAFLPNPKWRELPAMQPPTVGSLTIRVPGVPSPVVVLPASRWTTVVTIWDVICAVHRALATTSVDVLRQVNERANYGDTWRNKQDTDIGQAELTLAIQRYFRTARIWWVGLYKSQWENNVWSCIPVEPSGGKGTVESRTVYIEIIIEQRKSFFEAKVKNGRVRRVLCELEFDEFEIFSGKSLDESDTDWLFLNILAMRETQENLSFNAKGRIRPGPQLTGSSINGTLALSAGDRQEYAILKQHAGATSDTISFDASSYSNRGVVMGTVRSFTGMEACMVSGVEVPLQGKTSFNLRIEWPGYEKHAILRPVNIGSGKITLAKLALEICGQFSAFLSTAKADRTCTGLSGYQKINEQTSLLHLTLLDVKRVGPNIWTVNFVVQLH
ncbi:hypothetical protein CPC08DRAFT_727057 [Agrocybe pediades]|nr:hypothetical protein CPC08DRAFT_727057 [Agrocybe pediades]